MTTIDEELKQMLEDCPILLDKDFQRQPPGIAGVAGFLESAAKTHYRMSGKYEPFDRVGVDNITDYIKLVQEGNPEAVRMYERVRDILRLG